MKLKTLIITLIIEFIIGCSGTNQNNTERSKLELEQTPLSKGIEPTGTSTQPQKSEAITSSGTQSKISVAQAAQLTDSQVKSLVFLEKNSRLGKGFKILLPTYLPAGFIVDELEILNNNDTNPQYRIVYRKLKDNSCFRLGGDNGQWGGPPAGYKTVEALSPVLGKVILEYTEFDQQIGGSLIKFRNEPVMKDKTGYSFISSPSIAPNCKNSISPQEAVKIVEYLKYLNP